MEEVPPMVGGPAFGMHDDPLWPVSSEGGDEHRAQGFVPERGALYPPFPELYDDWMQVKTDYAPRSGMNERDVSQLSCAKVCIAQAREDTCPRLPIKEGEVQWVFVTDPEPVLLRYSRVTNDEETREVLQWMDQQFPRDRRAKQFDVSMSAILKTMIEQTAVYCFVRRRQGEITAAVFLNIAFDHTGATVVHIEAMAVGEAHRGSGVADSMLRFIDQMAIDLSKSTMAYVVMQTVRNDFWKTRGNEDYIAKAIFSQMYASRSYHFWPDCDLRSRVLRKPEEEVDTRPVQVQYVEPASRKSLAVVPKPTLGGFVEVEVNIGEGGVVWQLGKVTEVTDDDDFVDFAVTINGEDDFVEKYNMEDNDWRHLRVGSLLGAKKEWEELVDKNSVAKKKSEELVAKNSVTHPSKKQKGGGSAPTKAPRPLLSRESRGIEESGPLFDAEAIKQLTDRRVGIFEASRIVATINQEHGGVGFYWGPGRKSPRRVFVLHDLRGKRHNSKNSWAAEIMYQRNLA